MARMGRPGLTDGQKAELWERWKKGESLSDIGCAIGKHAGSVFGVLRLDGGIFSARRLSNKPHFEGPGCRHSGGSPMRSESVQLTELHNGRL